MTSASHDLMESPPTASPASGGQDISLRCNACGLALRVAAAMSSSGVTCQRCGNMVRLPTVGGAPPARDQIQRQLKENESQRIEVTSQINQLCIQLHRWKLRLQTLNERKAELETEFHALEKRKAS